MFGPLLSAIACLACLILIGFIGGKLKIIDAVSTERLSVLVMKIGQPFLIINSIISQQYSPERLKIGLSITLLGVCMHACMAAVAYFLSKPIKQFDARKISRYAMFFANCGFIGFPIAESVLGKEGLFYGAFFILSFHLFVWTLGIVILAEGRKDIKITPKSIFLNFGTVPCAIGFLIFVTRLPLPDFVLTLSSYLAGICTPLSILIAGSNIARRNLKAMFTNKTIYFTAFIKLIFMPLAVSTVLWLIGLPDYMVIFGTIMAAMPSASVATMFGEMYRIDPGYAAELVGTSTILCTFTILPMVTYAQWLCSLR